MISARESCTDRLPIEEGWSAVVVYGRRAATLTLVGAAALLLGLAARLVLSPTRLSLPIGFAMGAVLVALVLWLLHNRSSRRQADSLQAIRNHLTQELEQQIWATERLKAESEERLRQERDEFQRAVADVSRMAAEATRVLNDTRMRYVRLVGKYRAVRERLGAQEEDRSASWDAELDTAADGSDRPEDVPPRHGIGG